VQKPNDKNSECSAFRFLTQRASLWRWPLSQDPCSMLLGTMQWVV
jgi:hypothetical protein